MGRQGRVNECKETWPETITDPGTRLQEHGPARARADRVES